MSVQLIQQHHTAVDRKIRYGGSSKESAVRNEFYNLVQRYARLGSPIYPFASPIGRWRNFGHGM